MALGSSIALAHPVGTADVETLSESSRARFALRLARARVESLASVQEGHGTG